ncbi:methyl-accepting chemotaxis protein [Paucibacter sp. R3-3]|uniref:Methyl-accepting chemotaxis protein n=1 Tax=Roseateles agri TaxID=3098619 RepID=A0ABU5DUH2_9BURK|nr:methyl-accepting chemotaxis protein [Paucibacter sp. R3-3]MDY0749112.1 methyl-accepting chemotaxis protein [Paucibacter sp. R3-3]
MWTFGKKIAMGFALAFVLMLFVGGMAYRSIESLTRTSYAVSHTGRVLDQLALLMRIVNDTESQQRGYMLTGDETYLPQMQASREAFPKPIKELREDLADSPAELQMLAAVVEAAQAKMDYCARAVEVYRSSGRDTGLKLVQTGDGKALMDDLVAKASVLEGSQRRLVRQRADEVEAAASTANRAIGYGTLLCLVVITGAGFILTRALTQQIGSAVQHVQRSSNELQSAATQQAAGARESSTAMTEITTTITELLAASRQIAESAQRVAAVAEQTVDAARTGDGTVQLAKDSITGIRQQVDMVVDHMLDLGRKSQQIGAVLDIVSELAEQTNILAINATIEATGAGEMGRRFGVVADEIRKLADRVAGSTKEIRNLIDDVRSAVNTTVMATETGSKAVDLGARQFSEVATAFTKIAGLVATTTDAAREIELSTKQQTTAVEQVNVAISNTAQSTRETEASSAQTFQTARQLSSLSRELLRMVQPQELAAHPESVAA